MATGCKQGDTFGSLLYADGFQSTLFAVQDVLALLRIQDQAGGCSTTGGGEREYSLLLMTPASLSMDA